MSGNVGASNSNCKGGNDSSKEGAVPMIGVRRSRSRRGSDEGKRREGHRERLGFFWIWVLRKRVVGGEFFVQISMLVEKVNESTNV